MHQVMEVMAVARSDGHVQLEMWGSESAKDTNVVMTVEMALKAAERLLHAARSVMMEGKRT